MSTPPLAGLKVADFSWVVAGPVVGRALADFGATVVRVESCARIETARLMQPFYEGVRTGELGAVRHLQRRQSRCHADLKTEEGRDVARDLARWADVVVESFSPGQMASWGLDYDVDPRDNPSVDHAQHRR